ncbi:hypothetical protein DVH05_022045 [Phytophthora capsici]|nr:hypothetical protein DVH05_022045 [Phytophthora capsici]
MVKSIKHKPICQHHLSGKNETTRKQEDYPTSKLQQSEQQQQQLERQWLLQTISPMMISSPWTGGNS